MGVYRARSVGPLAPADVYALALDAARDDDDADANTDASGNGDGDGDMSRPSGGGAGGGARGGGAAAAAAGSGGGAVGALEVRRGGLKLLMALVAVVPDLFGAHLPPASGVQAVHMLRAIENMDRAPELRAIAASLLEALESKS